MLSSMIFTHLLCVQTCVTIFYTRNLTFAYIFLIILYNHNYMTIINVI